MARTLRSDKVLFWEAVALVCASLVMLYSASAVVASNRGGDPYDVFFHQLPWAVLGLLALLVVMRVDYHVLRKPEVIWPIVAFTIVALMAVFLFPARKGATRWIGCSDCTSNPPSSPSSSRSCSQRPCSSGGCIASMT
jgi:cell division protein FtsW